MILGAGQRRQAVRLQQIDGQLALDDLDVAHHRFGRVRGEADDVAGENRDAGLLPLQQHLAVLGDFVLLLSGAEQRVGIDAFEADEDARALRRGPPSR